MMEAYSKHELRHLNLKAWDGHDGLFPVADSLDSSMKKNTAFIKRIRAGVVASALSTLVQDVQTLSLHKYLSELISACFDGFYKLKTTVDVNAAVRTVSALHLRFGPHAFTKFLVWHIVRGLAVPSKTVLKTMPADVREKEEKERLVKQRPLLRVATELWLAGIVRTADDAGRPEEATKETLAADSTKPKPVPVAGKAGSSGIPISPGGESEPVPLRAVKDLLQQDRDHLHLPLVVGFVKTFSHDLFEPMDEGEEPLVEDDTRLKFRRSLVYYFDLVAAHLVRDKDALEATSRRNAEVYVKSGEVFEDRQANFERQSKAVDRLTSNVLVLAEVLGTTMPDLRTKEAAAPDERIVGLVRSCDYAPAESAGIWEDDEERRFYEGMVDLRDAVPAVLLDRAKKKKPDGPDGRLKRADSKTGSTVFVDPTGQASTGEGDDLSVAVVNKTVVAQLDALLSKLPETGTKEAIDEIAVEFCYVNSKASRNRLVKALQDIPKGRLDLLPLYARLIATVGKSMPDVSQAMIDYLDDEFRSLQRRKQRDFLSPVRLSNVRYLAELTKFGAVPEHVIFHCFKVAVDDFSRSNIDILCVLLENCGRYLFRRPDTHDRMAGLVETIQRKKAVQNLGQQDRLVIENACYYVNPPPRQVVKPKERTPTDLFLRKLVYLDLRRGTVDKIVRTFKKLNWEDPATVKTMGKLLSRPDKMTYSNIHLLAAVVSQLCRFQPEFTIGVIDQVVEAITFGLELNDFQFNQSRLAMAKYLGELYVAKMVDLPVVFSTLYRILTFGHEAGMPTPGRLCSLDLPDDYFRIRLVCCLAETCGKPFSKGAGKKKLDFFLAFLQYYIYTKDPLPLDIEFVVQDMYNRIRPKWRLATSLPEAAELFADAVKANYKPTDKAAELGPTDSDEPEGRSDGDENDDPTLTDDDDEDRGVDRDDDEEDDEDEDEDDDEDDEDEDEDGQNSLFGPTKKEDDIDPELEADFDRELAKMMAESYEARKPERKPIFNTPIPIRVASEVAAATSGANQAGSATTASTASAGPTADASGSASGPGGASGVGNDIGVGQSAGQSGVGSSTGTEAPTTGSGQSESTGGTATIGAGQPTAGVMKFAVLTKKGNKPQTRTIDLPSESNLAQAISSSKQAEEEERQRIKQLVLTYNQSTVSDNDADGPPLPQPSQARVDKASKSRSGQRARKLQLEDVMW